VLARYDPAPPRRFPIELPFVIASPPAQRLALTSKAAWIIWGALQAGVVLLLGIMVLQLKLVIGHPVLPTSQAWFANVFAGIGALPVVAGAVVHWRLVRGEPGDDSRSVRRVRAMLVDANRSKDPDALALAIAGALENDFRGASILSWAMGEGGALLSAISFCLCGFQPVPVAVFALWYLSMLFAAPTRALRDSFRVSRLRVAGLTDEQVRTLLARADSIRPDPQPRSSP
jgi:hypothetical protein